MGAYNIVPTTQVVGEFSEWIPKLEWLWRVTQFMMEESCTGSRLINKLNLELQTGYTDIEELALSHGRVAETAWLKQASCWVLYGRLPSFGQPDFFLREVEGGYGIQQDLLPHFVSSSTAKSIMFIGKSLHQIRTKSKSSASCIAGLLPKHLTLLSSLDFPITPSAMTNTISAIRKSLSQSALQDLLPLHKIREVLRILHDYFLLDKGEFAIALINEADEKIRSRWQRSDDVAYERRGRLSDVVVKDGEVAAVLERTWTAMLSFHGTSEEDEDELERARELITLYITESKSSSQSIDEGAQFLTTLFSVPTALSLKIQSPLDLFLRPNDIKIYSSISAYLLSIRRAHLRLSDLWKITSLRRHHPAPPHPPFAATPQGRAYARLLRDRQESRAASMRTVWATSSAALYLLGELGAYFQGEVVKGTWERFQEWVSPQSAHASRVHSRATSRPVSRPTTSHSAAPATHDTDISMALGTEAPVLSTMRPKAENTHDPQTLSAAHQRFLLSLRHQLLLTAPAFTTTLFALLQKVDYVVALVHRIHTVWTSIDLETDEGVVDAFNDFRRDEAEVLAQLGEATATVKGAINGVVAALREIDQQAESREDELEALEGQVEDFVGTDEEVFKPRKVGRVDRLLMKLDFGGWLSDGVAGGVEAEEEL